ncbi:MAG TPA: IS200/IS605 family transposase [Chitinophagaceae bacterium]|nr:IS200/IS605 family transposase [Chitinophagaceae bacterium]
MAFVKIWVHAVWSTKNREQVLEKTILEIVCNHIKENGKVKGIFIECINGYFDHLHCLMLLNADTSISKQMQLIKGESSFWINKNKIIKGRFEWADEYFASSVSEDKLDIARAYILNQHEHHKKVTFKDEYEKFLKHFGFDQG